MSMRLDLRIPNGAATAGAGPSNCTVRALFHMHMASTHVCSVKAEKTRTQSMPHESISSAVAPTAKHAPHGPRCLPPACAAPQRRAHQRVTSLRVPETQPPLPLERPPRGRQLRPRWSAPAGELPHTQTPPPLTMPLAPAAPRPLLRECPHAAMLLRWSQRNSNLTPTPQKRPRREHHHSDT